METAASETVLIVGGGVAGAATAWHLARRGAPVRLLEREDLLGTESSGKNAAILRTLTPDPVLTSLAQRSARFLREPPSGFTDVPLVDACGLVLPADPAHAAELATWLDQEDLPEAEWIGEEEVRALAPHAGRPGPGVLLPREGRLDVAALMAGFEHGARAAGAEILTGRGVRELVVRDGAVRGVRLADGEELAGRVVLAAGGWAGRLGAAAGSRVRLRPTRRHLLVTAPDERIDPRWPVVWAHQDRPFYFRPESGGLLLCACDQVDVDPDACDTDPEVLEAIALGAREHVPAFADAGVASYWCGLRTLTRDGRFAIGPDPDLPGLLWVAGLGGHGMVAGPEVGRLACAAVLGDDEPGLAPLDPARLVPAGV